MELARNFCNEVSVKGFVNPSGGSFYDVKKNRCYAICTCMNFDTTNDGKDGFTMVSLLDVHSSQTLAMYMAFGRDQKRSFGYINNKLTSDEKAKAYIKRMTTE